MQHSLHNLRKLQAEEQKLTDGYRHKIMSSNVGFMSATQLTVGDSVTGRNSRMHGHLYRVY